MSNSVSNVSSRVSTLEGNFNMALTNLYNACVDKGSTPTSQTISAIVTAVENISTGFNLEEYGLTKDDIISTNGPFSFTTYNNQSVLNGTLGSAEDTWAGKLVIAIPDTAYGLPVILG